MLSLLARLLGLFTIAGAIVALVVDGTKSIAASTLTVTPLGQAWFSYSRDSLAAAQAAVETHIESHVGHWVWDPAIQWLLTLPTWLVFGVLGALLVIAGSRTRRRRPSFA